MISHLLKFTTTLTLVLAQTTQVMGQPMPAPRPDLPQIQPPRPSYPSPVQPYPGQPYPVRPQPPRPPGYDRPQIQPPQYHARNYAGILRCESFNNRWRQCNVNTENRVELINSFSRACQQGRTWGYTNRYIWVEQGCRAEFGYGYAYGSNPYPVPPTQPYPQPYPVPQPQPTRDRGPSAGAVIAGVVVAGGLIALLASRNRSSTAPASTSAQSSEPPQIVTYPAGPPAALQADISSVPRAARASVQNCLADAARQIGVTGGTKLTYNRTTSLVSANGGWRFGAAITASYPDGDRTMNMYCRATSTRIFQLDFS